MKNTEKKIIELFQEMASGQGLNDSLLVTLFAKLYLEPEPVAMDDLAKETGYSLASVSNKIRVMEHIFQLKRVKKPGSKKIYLYMEKDIFRIWKEALIKKEEWVIKKVKNKLPPLIEEIRKKARTENDRKKMELLQAYYDKMLKFGSVLDKIINEFEKVGL